MKTAFLMATLLALTLGALGCNRQSNTVDPPHGSATAGGFKAPEPPKLPPPPK